MSMGKIELIFKDNQQTTIYGVDVIGIKGPFLAIHQITECSQKTRYYRLEDIRTFNVVDIEDLGMEIRIDNPFLQIDAKRKDLIKTTMEMYGYPIVSIKTIIM